MPPKHAERVRYFESIELPADFTAPALPSLASVSVAGNYGVSTGFISIMQAAGVSIGQVSSFSAHLLACIYQADTLSTFPVASGSIHTSFCLAR